MQRTERLRKKLPGLGVDGILISDLANVRYLSGFTGSSAYVIITKNQAILLTDFRYQEQAAHEVKGYSIVIEHNEKTSEIKDICGGYGIKQLGFEDHNITFAFYNKLLKRKIALKPISNIVESLRIIKSAEELSCIKTAVKRAESAFKTLLPRIRVGVTEKKLALQLEYFLKKEGCKTVPFAAIVASGPMSALPHAQPTERKLKKGDLVVIDWGGECDGYFSDMTRTLLIKGNNISKQKELYYNVFEAQNRAIQSVKAGVKSAVIDAAARDYIKEKGFDEYFGHGTGHGVGLAVHEKPVVSWRNNEVIAERMVFTIEPGIYLPDFGGVRIEDLVVAGKRGADVLTSLPKKLKIIAR